MTAEAGPTCGAIDCENHRPNTHPYGRREAMRRTVRQMLTTDRDPDEVLRLVMLIADQYADFGTPNGPPILDALWATRE